MTTMTDDADATRSGIVAPTDQLRRPGLPESKPEPSQVPGPQTPAIACFYPVPTPGTPPGSHLPGVQAAGAISQDGQIVTITRVANAVPGKPDGEVDTRPLVPVWRRTSTQA